MANIASTTNRPTSRLVSSEDPRAKGALGAAGKVDKAGASGARNVDPRKFPSVRKPSSTAAVPPRLLRYLAFAALPGLVGEALRKPSSPSSPAIAFPEYPTCAVPAADMTSASVPKSVPSGAAQFITVPSAQAEPAPIEHDALDAMLKNYETHVGTRDKDPSEIIENICDDKGRFIPEKLAREMREASPESIIRALNLKGSWCTSELEAAAVSLETCFARANARIENPDDHFTPGTEPSHEMAKRMMVGFLAMVQEFHPLIESNPDIARKLRKGNLPIFQMQDLFPRGQGFTGTALVDGTYRHTVSLDRNLPAAFLQNVMSTFIHETGGHAGISDIMMAASLHAFQENPDLLRLSLEAMSDLVAEVAGKSRLVNSPYIPSGSENLIQDLVKALTGKQNPSEKEIKDGKAFLVRAHLGDVQAATAFAHAGRAVSQQPQWQSFKTPSGSPFHLRGLLTLEGMIAMASAVGIIYQCLPRGGRDA